MNRIQTSPRRTHCVFRGGFPLPLCVVKLLQGLLFTAGRHILSGACGAFTTNHVGICPKLLCCCRAYAVRVSTSAFTDSACILSACCGSDAYMIPSTGESALLISCCDREEGASRARGTDVTTGRYIIGCTLLPGTGYLVCSRFQHMGAGGTKGQYCVGLVRTLSLSVISRWRSLEANRCACHRG